MGIVLLPTSVHALPGGQEAVVKLQFALHNVKTELHVPAQIHVRVPKDIRDPHVAI